MTTFFKQILGWVPVLGAFFIFAQQLVDKEFVIPPVDSFSKKVLLLWQAFWTAVVFFEFFI